MNTSTVTRFTTRIRHSMLALTMLSAGASYTLAQDGHPHMDTMKRDQSSNSSAFLKVVRESTERFETARARSIKKCASAAPSSTSSSCPTGASTRGTCAISSRSDLSGLTC